MIRIITAFLLLFTGINAFALENLSANAVIEKVRQSYEALQDYQCTIDEWCTDGRRQEERTVRIYFKKPRMIRIDILEGNRPFDKGSVGVFKGGNKVTGHRGGILSPIVLNLSKDNPLATSIRGVMFDESDILTVINEFQFYIDRGTITASRSGNMCTLDCRTDKAKENKKISRDSVLIDETSWLPAGSERYEGGKLVEKSVFKNYTINAGLPDELFDARFDTERLKRGN